MPNALGSKMNYFDIIHSFGLWQLVLYGIWKAT